MLEHWLLNLAIESRIPLSVLFPEWIEQTLNATPLPGLTGDAYATALLLLFERGLIEFSSKEQEDLSTQSGVREMLARYLSLRSPEDSRWIKGETAEMRAERRALHYRPGLQVHFALTEFGGAAWEKLAEPDWSNIFTQSSNYSSGELNSPSLNLLMARLGWFSQLSDERVLLNTVKLQLRSDYEILYWKRLPLVYHAEFTTERQDEPALSYDPNCITHWWLDGNSWYKKPWALPDWPKE